MQETHGFAHPSSFKRGCGEKRPFSPHASFPFSLDWASSSSKNVLQKPDKFLHLPQIFAIERAESRWTDRLFIHLTLSGGSDASSDEDRNGRRYTAHSPGSRFRHQSREWKRSGASAGSSTARQPPQRPISNEDFYATARLPTFRARDTADNGFGVTSVTALLNRRASLPQRGTTIATIRKRRDKYEAQVRRARLPHISKTFRSQSALRLGQSRPRFRPLRGPASRTMTSGMQGRLV